ncbi:MAG: gamma-butyrobetaine hydroxylase-like domain-containing protein [Gammaproteobacteria bacterium]
MNGTFPRPIEIRARREPRELYVRFDDGVAFTLPFEYLRVFSPSAEVTGHGGGPRLLIAGKENVGVKAIEPIGQYAIRIVFDDGHDSGLYSWRILRELGENFEHNWHDYHQRLARAGVGKKS